MKGLCSSVFGGIYLYFWSNWLQAAENLHEFETALSIHIYLIFFIYCILQRAMFIASANTATVCKWESQPPNRNHMVRILSPDTSHAHTQEYTCYTRLIIIQVSLVLQSRIAQKMRESLQHDNYSTETTPVFVIPQVTSLSCNTVRVFTWTAVMP